MLSYIFSPSSVSAITTTKNTDASRKKSSLSHPKQLRDKHFLTSPARQASSSPARPLCSLRCLVAARFLSPRRLVLLREAGHKVRRFGRLQCTAFEVPCVSRWFSFFSSFFSLVVSVLRCLKFLLPFLLFLDFFSFASLCSPVFFIFRCLFRSLFVFLYSVF